MVKLVRALSRSYSSSDSLKFILLHFDVRRQFVILPLNGTTIINPLIHHLLQFHMCRSVAVASEVVFARGQEVEGKARAEGAKRPRFEGEARDKAGEGSGEGTRWAPQKIFENSNLK